MRFLLVQTKDEAVPSLMAWEKAAVGYTELGFV
jgi:hypothetical protein